MKDFMAIMAVPDAHCKRGLFKSRTDNGTSQDNHKTIITRQDSQSQSYARFPQIPLHPERVMALLIAIITNGYGEKNEPFYGLLCQNYQLIEMKDRS